MSFCWHKKVIVEYVYTEDVIKEVLKRLSIDDNLNLIYERGTSNPWVNFMIGFPNRDLKDVKKVDYVGFLFRVRHTYGFNRSVCIKCGKCYDFMDDRVNHLIKKIRKAYKKYKIRKQKEDLAKRIWEDKCE